jgi:purine-nucleoside phosphorylase
VNRPYSAEAAARAAEAIHARCPGVTPVLGIILGSGLSSLTEDIEAPVHVPFAEIPGFPVASVAGHPGALIIGTLAGVPVAVLAGRFHVYEGHSPQAVGFPVRVLHALGARLLLVSNAAGGINRAFSPGDLMIIEDHLNLMGTSPLVGPQEPTDVRFPDMSEPYDLELRDALLAAANTLDVTVHLGVFAGMLGPAYETRAEIRMLATLGADSVAMSTVPEVITARALSMRVAGISCIVNMAAGIHDAPLDHADVLAGAARIATQFRALVREFVRSCA